MRGINLHWISLALLAVLLASPVTAQDLRASLFTEIDMLLAEAKEMRADVLAPKSFGEFQKLYDRAEANLEKGKEIEKIQEDLTKATVHIQAAMEATELANVTFGAVMEARDDAAAADAANYAADPWGKAEKKFKEAATKLEGGDVNGARKRADEAEPMYRDAELAAIKTNYFQETRDLLAAADKNKVGKYAAITLQRSKDLLAEAEASLEADRYDTDVPRSLAREAKYEVKHAVHVAELLQKVDKKAMTNEELLLGAEDAMKKVAGDLDVVPMFDQGYGVTTEAVLTELDERSQKRSKLESRVADYERMTEEMQTQIAALESDLGGVSEERAAMQARMEAEARVRAQFAQVENTFSRKEAQVYRQGNQLLLRMVGLNFESGKSTIRPEYFGILTKVKNAINVFPGCKVVVEGHTDSHGSDELNQKLSQERASAVKQYLLANMELSPSNIDAVGYGESKPIASNETPEGREKNRRIDLVITPDLESMTSE